MTSLDLHSRGVVFARVKGMLTIRGPKGDVELQLAVKEEVSRRLAFVLTRRAPNYTYGRCECCGDEIEHYRAGDCDLCAYARQKALEARRKEAA